MQKERLEIKYCFPLEKAEELFEMVRPFMSLDQYGQGDENRGFYKVSSIYFDSSNFEYFWQHLEGHPTRKKIRIRKYASRPEGVFFLEVKNKVLMAMEKFRIRIEPSWLDSISHFKEFCDMLMNRVPSEKMVQMIYFDLLTLNINPVLFVCYHRIPYRSNYEHHVRLTLDYNIEVSKASDFLRFEHVYPVERILPSYLGVLELKCSRTIPRWLQDIVLRFRLTRIAYSKYQKGIEKVYFKQPIYS